MEDNLNIIGHQFQRDSLRKLYQDDRLPAAIMLCGQDGIGKQLVARELAGSLLCTGPAEADYGGCGSCETCKLLAADSHPDFHQVECSDRESSKVESLRELLYSLNLKSFSGSARIVLLNDAHSISTQGANILLKSLEEPRPNTFFILISSNPSALPITVRSRCQIWHFDALSEEEISSVLKTKGEIVLGEGEAVSNLTELAKLADGSLATLKQLHLHIDTWKDIQKTMDKICDGSVDTALDFATSLKSDRENLPIMISMIRTYARSRMIAEKDPELKERWAVTVTNLISAEYLLFERNLNAYLVLSNLLLSLANNRNETGEFIPGLGSDTLLEDMVVV